MRFCLLASGSKGNAIWVENGSGAVLLDNGLSAKEFLARATEAGLHPDRLRAMVVSHEHIDHVRGVGPLARRLHLPVYASSRAVEASGSLLSGFKLETLTAGLILELAGFTILPLSVSHDASDPLVFVFRSGLSSLGVATDLGTVTHLIREHFRELGGIILEFNHDLKLLVDGPYPPYLKQRVRSRYGHLSNEEAAVFLDEINHPGLRQVVLGHLSEVNNTPELALAAAKEALSGGAGQPELVAASQGRPTQVFDLA